jgi:squalene-associated FAD-dependent desaturase
MTPDATIVGGGVSGLAAAVALARAGARVCLLEARGVLGGRATSFTDPRTNEVFDNGQHALMGCYRETFAMLDAIGARDTVGVQDALHVPMVTPDGRPTALRCPAWPPPWHLLGGVLGWDGLGWADRLRLLRIAPALRRAVRAAGTGRDPLPCRSEETVEEWLTRHGQRGTLSEWLWEPLALAALNQDIRRVAAPVFVRVLGRVFGPRREDSSIALLGRPLREVFAEPARRAIEAAGGSIRLNALARIVVGGGGVERIEVRGDAVPVANVVLATPWFTWPRVLTGDVAALHGVLDAAQRTRWSPIVTVTLGFDRPVLSAPLMGFPQQEMQWAFDVAPLHGAAPGTRVSLVSSGADEMLRRADGELVGRARAVLDQVGPDARAATMVCSRVVREPRATFSLAPGQPARPSTRSAIRGLYLASDWADTGLPATIEGAIEAGHRAAAALLADDRGRRA